MNVKFFGSTPKPSSVSKEFQNAFIAKILSPESALSRGCPTQRCLREKLSRGIRRPHSVLNLSRHTTFMPTAPPPSRDVALETRFFWERFKTQIIAAAIIVLLAAIVFTGYRFYSDRRAAAASAAFASANTAQEYEQVIARYANTAAAADAYILLAEAQRKEGKFAEANKTLETFIAKYPNYEFVSTAKMAMAANLDSMGKTDEALAMYQQIASTYPNSYAAPLAMLSQVYILKSKNRNDDARRICETMLTQFRTSFWAGEAMQQLRLLKPITTSTPLPAAVQTIPPMLAIPPAPAPQAPPAPPTAPSPKKP